MKKYKKILLDFLKVLQWKMKKIKKVNNCQNII